jgi:hypothetical protein
VGSGLYLLIAKRFYLYQKKTKKIKSAFVRGTLKELKLGLGIGSEDWEEYYIFMQLG